MGQTKVTFAKKKQSSTATSTSSPFSFFKLNLHCSFIDILIKYTVTAEMCQASSSIKLIF